MGGQVLRGRSGGPGSPGTSALGVVGRAEQGRGQGQPDRKALGRAGGEVCAARG